MQLNHAQRELTIKIVYYGPGLSGKTTNLQQVHDRAHPGVRGRLMTVETQDDRTLFFDLLPLFFNTPGGFKVKLKLFTVPGQALHNATRRVVLQNADAVAFIVDSRKEAQDESNSYWRNLHENLLENGGDSADMPVVIQYNKRDLPGTKTAEEIEQTRRKGKEPVVEAVAIRGVGVLETLHAVLELAYRSMDARAHIGQRVGMTEDDFLRQVFTHLDLAGTTLEGRYPASDPEASQ